MPPKQRKKTNEVSIELEAGNASMIDLGKALGPLGANTRAIKVEYDDATAAQRGEIIPVVVSLYEDRSHSLRYKTPPTSFLIRRAIGLESGSSDAGKKMVGRLNAEQLRSIAERKLPDLNATDVEAAMKIVAGSARSMGITVD
jgi:large subunit ribosomal protein L11